MVRWPGAPTATHAGFTPRRTGRDTTQWTTPTGHAYTVLDDPLPVGKWPPDRSPPAEWPPEFYDYADWISEADIRDAIGPEQSLNDFCLLAETAEHIHPRI